MNNINAEQLKSKLATLQENRAKQEKILQDLEIQRQNGIATLNALQGAILLADEMLKELEPAPKE